MKKYSKPELIITAFEGENTMVIAISNVNTINIKKDSAVNVINF